MLEFAESGHRIFRATSPLSRGRLKKQRHGFWTKYFCDVFLVNVNYERLIEECKKDVRMTNLSLSEQLQSYLVV